MMTMMMETARLEMDSDKHLCISIPEANSKKFDDINNNYYPSKDKEEIFDDCHSTMKSNVLSSDKHENDTTLLTTTTMTTTVEVKVKTTKTSSRKRKLDLLNSNTEDEHQEQIDKQTAISKNKKKVRIPSEEIDDDEQQTMTTTKKKTTAAIDQSSGTDESAFGSCEPGTSVVLHGIVWNETDKGVLVVNITWRGKTYVGALLNTTEQNWAPPRYKSDIRSTKTNPTREHPLTYIPPIHDSSERILRNGKRRGSSTTVTPSSTTKTRSFKLPMTPMSSKTDERTANEKILLPSSNNLQDEEETGDNDSSRSVSPTTSGISTTSSSSPPLSNTNENSSMMTTTTIPIDLPNCQTTTTTTISNESHSKPNDSLIPYHFPNEILFPSSFKKLSSTSSPVSSSSSPSGSYLPLPSQLYFNSLTSTLSSLSKSSH